MDTQQFEQLVARAIESLPEEIRERLENIDIIVDDKPTPEQLRRSGLSRNETLLGLYEGVPLTERTQGYGFVMPDKITIFQRPIEASCRSEKQITSRIQQVVRHEIAHHFGIDDDRLEELGRY
ncbi:MAG: metallopeptidase family protein [Dehalococcoidales bacterium]|nr:metallopeptidase family protein [Dehalococcoidales bacterium]